MTTVALIALALAAFPAGLFLLNLAFYRRLPTHESGVRLEGDAPSSPAIAEPRDRRPPTRLMGGVRGVRANAASLEPTLTPSPSPRLSVLIPARNEAGSIRAAVESVLANRDADFEVLVLDDHSTDETAGIVAELAARDRRVRLLAGRPLPDGWCGKQHACWQLANEARHELLVFLDADVRLSADALGRFAAWFAARPGLHLASGVPRQITGTFLERLLIPLIHFVLLGYLPMVGARLTRWSAFAAGCGQLFVARRDAYFAAGGHRGIRSTLHDGVRLPRAFRAAGLCTDLFDPTDVALCRMYTSAAEVWRGLGKNATEGMAHPAAILPWTFLLVGGHVVPWLVLVGGAFLPTDVWFPAWAAAGLSLLPRLIAVWRFRQSLLGALLHPVGVTALVLIQWLALARWWRGRPQEWRGRSYPPAASVVPRTPATP